MYQFFLSAAHRRYTLKLTSFFLANQLVCVKSLNFSCKNLSPFLEGGLLEIKPRAPYMLSTHSPHRVHSPNLLAATVKDEQLGFMWCGLLLLPCGSFPAKLCFIKYPEVNIRHYVFHFKIMLHHHMPLKTQ